MIEVKVLSFSYKDRPVLHDLSFDLAEGENLMVLGPNGAGKSTLFRCILGILKDYQGEVLIDRKEVRTMKSREIAAKLAYIPQAGQQAFHYSVMDTVLMGTAASFGTLAMPGEKQYAQAKKAMEKLGISDLKDRDFMEISGGEQQLCLIARALSQNAGILVMDEPTSNLDYGNQLRVMNEIRKLTREGYSVIQSNHNPDQAFLFADRILAIKGGERIALGRPVEVITPELLNRLYGVDVRVESLYGGKIHLTIPDNLRE